MIIIPFLRRQFIVLAALVIGVCGPSCASLVTNPYYVEDFSYTPGTSLVGNANPSGVWQGTASANQMVIDADGPCMKMTGGVGSFEASQSLNYAGKNGVIRVHFKARTQSGSNATMWSLWLDDTSGAYLARFYGSANTCRGRIGASNDVTNIHNLLPGVWNDLDIKIDTLANTSEFFLNGVSMGVLSHGTGPGNVLGEIRFTRLDYSPATGHTILFDEVRIGEEWWTPTSLPAAPAVTSPSNGALVDITVPVQWQGDLHDGYEVHVNTTNVATNTDGWDSGQVSSAADSCVTGDLVSGMQYYVFVRLHNPLGWGAWSSAGRTFTVKSIPPPAAPEIITPTDGANVTLQQPVVRWTGEAHDRYEVHVNTTGNPDDSNAWDSGDTAGSGDSCDAGILANGSYYAFVRVHGPGGWGPWSDGKSFSVNFTGAEMKKGWIFIRDDLPYHLDLLTHASEYHINQVQISHSIMMYAWEPINDPSIRYKVNQLINTAHANGVTEVVLWVHDIQFVNMPSYFLVGGKVNLDDPTFWTWMASQYEQLFQVCPNADGLVFTFSENFEGADFNDRTATIHTGRTPEDTMAQAIETIWNVCRARNKSLYVRNWHYAGVDTWIRNAILRNDPRIWMMSKATGAADWNVIQEDYDIIGTCTGHPELIEFDVIGEYWGLGETPWAGIDFLKHLWTDFSLPRGADGMAARVDRESGIAYELPNRINMFALDALADYPDIDTESIYEYWCSHWFGQDAAGKVASALKRSFDITNAAYSLPTIYPFSNYVARGYTLRSLFDLDCIKPALQLSEHLQPGAADYQVFRSQFVNAANRLGQSVPSTLFGDFTPAFSNQTNPTCSVTVVDAVSGLNSELFRVDFSSDGGANWLTYRGFTVTADGGVTDPYHITAGPVLFGQLRAGRNRVRFSATNLSGITRSEVFTIRGLDEGFVTLGSSIVYDGITHVQGGDGDTVAATAGGRSCRTPASSGDLNLYFRTDDGFAFDRSPQTIYLQVDYYGSSGSITPYYDSTLRFDEPLSPVYLSGGSGWRTATWRLDNVNFGHRISSQGADVRLYVGSAAGQIYISAVRLSYEAPGDALEQPQHLQLSTASHDQVSLAWDAVPGATMYQVCRDGTAVGWPAGASFVDSGVSSNTQYLYTVTAYQGTANTSCASDICYVTTLSVPPSLTTVTSVPLAKTWQTSNTFTFDAVGGFGEGTVAYYQYVWNESPTHTWTGSEPTWPGTGAPPSGAGWNSWRPTSSPTESGSNWLLYQGSTTQRLMSEDTMLENGTPTWVIHDQSRINNSKVKLALWPNLTVNRDTGMTVTVRMRAAHSPLGWYNTGANFGINLPDCLETGVVVRPDFLQIRGPSANSAGLSVDNGYTYHTYTLTLKNATPGNNATAKYELYRDGQFVTSLNQPPASDAEWTGPFFGQPTSDAIGAWAWQWIAWNTSGAFVPGSPDGALALTAPHFGSSYYLHLRGFNSDGVPNGSVDLGPYYYWNGSDPVPPTVTDDGTYSTRDAIHATWSPVALLVTRYEYAVGTTPGAQDIHPFTSVGAIPVREVTKTGLNLQEGAAYFVTIKGVVGSQNSIGVSDGIEVAPMRERVSGAKMLADGEPVALYGKTVTAVFDDIAYVQEANGMGVRIVTSRPVASGEVVDLAGTMSGSAAEREVLVDAVFVKGGEEPKPVALSGRTLGGQALLYDPLTKTGQAGVRAYRQTELIDVPGLNNIGALVRICGRVTWRDSGTFYVDDGSIYADYPQIGPGSPAGIKVVVPAGVTSPAENSLVVVTAISSVYQADDGLRRLLLVRQPEDIVQL